MSRLCTECQEKLSAPDTAWGYCPHEQMLAVADFDQNHEPAGTFSYFGPMSLEQAEAVVRAGIAEAVGDAEQDGIIPRKH